MEPKKQPGYVFHVFGMGFGEMIVLGVVLLVVVGPRELPRLLRSLGRSIAKLRRMSSDLRKQSGIDDIIDEEGLREDLDAIRSLSKGRILQDVVNGVTQPRRPVQRALPAKPLTLEELKPPAEGEPPDPEQEYPVIGPDAYGARADDAEPEPKPEPQSNPEVEPEPEPAATEPVSTEPGPDLGAA